MKLFTIALAVITLLVSSCSIQKRRFNKGWNIEWNGRHSTATSNSEAHVFESEKSKNESLNNELVVSNSKNDEVALESSTLIRFSEEVTSNEVVSNETNRVAVKKEYLKVAKPKKPKLGQKYERSPTGKIAYVSGLSGAAVGTVGWILFLSSVTLGNLGIALILTGFVAGLVALYFASKSKKQIDANPGKFNPDSGKKWAYLALLVGVAGMIAGVIVASIIK